MFKFFLILGSNKLKANATGGDRKFRQQLTNAPSFISGKLVSEKGMYKGVWYAWARGLGWESGCPCPVTALPSWTTPRPKVMQPEATDRSSNNQNPLQALAAVYFVFLFSFFLSDSFLLLLLVSPFFSVSLSSSDIIQPLRGRSQETLGQSVFEVK